MNRPLLGICLSILVAPTVAQSAADFLPPARGGAAELAQPADAELVDDPELGKLARAATLEDAAVKSAVVLTEGDGCMAFESKDGSGIGWMASETAQYDTKSTNPDVVRLARRYAYCDAYLRAKVRLTQTLKGLSVEGLERLATNDSTTVGGEGARITGERGSQESLREVVNGTIRGASLFRVDDDGAGQVRVQVYVTPMTQRGVQTRGAEGLVAADLVRGLDAVLSEIKQGVVPPVGGRVIQVPGSGELAFVGFGSELIPTVPNPDARFRAKRAATQAAEMRARAALLSTMRGEDVKAEASLDAASETKFSHLEQIAQSIEPDAEGAAKELQGSRSRHELTVKRAIETLVKGELPKEVQQHAYEYAETGWIVSIAVYIPEVIAERKPAIDPEKAGPSGASGTDPRKEKDGEERR